MEFTEWFAMAKAKIKFLDESGNKIGAAHLYETVAAALPVFSQWFFGDIYSTWLTDQLESLNQVRPQGIF